MPTFTLTIKGLNTLIAGFKKAPETIKTNLQTAINTAALQITQSVKSFTPHVTGNLQSSIYPEFGFLRAVISPHKDYAIYVHEGTGIYGIHGTPIVPTTKKALYWKGALHPVRSVRGQRANPFMVNGMNAALPEVNATFQKQVDKTLEVIASGGE